MIKNFAKSKRNLFKCAGSVTLKLVVVVYRLNRLFIALNFNSLFYSVKFISTYECKMNYLKISCLIFITFCHYFTYLYGNHLRVFSTDNQSRIFVKCPLSRIYQHLSLILEFWKKKFFHKKQLR